MSMKSALALSLLIPIGLTFSQPAYATGPNGPQGERPSFGELDANSDGQLTLEELQAARASHVTRADADGDGSLSRDEMIAAAMERLTARVDARMDRFDDDEDGLLSANELDDMRPRGPNPERMFSRIDADGDGVISEAEFDEIAERMQRRGGGRGFGHEHRNDASNG